MTADQKADAKAVARLKRKVADYEHHPNCNVNAGGECDCYARHYGQTNADIDRVLRLLSEREARIAELERELEPLAVLGGPIGSSIPAFHDLEDDVVVYENSGHCITAGDCRRARDLLQRKERGS